MDIKALRYFLAVAREENMTRAAEILHVTQPTISKQLKALEEELGKLLFIRHAFSIELTDEGQLLRKRAEDLIDMADKITNEFSALDDITGGSLYFGLAESYQINYLAKQIKDYVKANETQIHLTHTQSTGGDDWNVIDIGPVLVHLMSADARNFYELEKLWHSGNFIKGTPVN